MVMAPTVTNSPQPPAPAGSFLRALRPALLCATLTGSLPLSAADGSFRLRSVAAVRSLAVTALILAHVVVRGVNRPAELWHTPRSVADLYMLILGYGIRFKWVGIMIWVWWQSPRLSRHLSACREYESKFGAGKLKGPARCVFLYAAFHVLAVVFHLALKILNMLQDGRFHWLAVRATLEGGMMHSTFVFWHIIFDGLCWCMGSAFDEIDRRMRLALEAGSMSLLRQLVRQHGRLCRLVDDLCDIFSGFVVVSIYEVVLELGVSIYMGLRRFPTVGHSTSAVSILRSLLTSYSLLMLKLTTNAGYSCSRRSRQSQTLLRDRLLEASDPELERLHQQLAAQQATMDMAGYFRLNKELFVQSVKDIMALLVAVAQFDMES